MQVKVSGVPPASRTLLVSGYAFMLIYTGVCALGVAVAQKSGEDGESSDKIMLATSLNLVLTFLLAFVLISLPLFCMRKPAKAIGFLLPGWFVLAFIGQLATFYFAISFLREKGPSDEFTLETLYWLCQLILGSWSIFNLLCYAKCHSTRSKHLRELEGNPDTVRLDALAAQHRLQIEKAKAEAKL